MASGDLRGTNCVRRLTDSTCLWPFKSLFIVRACGQSLITGMVCRIGPTLLPQARLEVVVCAAAVAVDCFGAKLQGNAMCAGISFTL